MPLGEYFETAEWHRRAEAAVQSWGGKCALCGKDGASAVHLTNPSDRGWEGKNDVLLLCLECDAAVDAQSSPELALIAGPTS